MNSSAFQFEILATGPDCAARRSTFHTPHGKIQMPAFMPVATQATVKGLAIDQVRATGAEMILGNTYHLCLRPGADVVAKLGGLHGFTGWDGPILTDSGGFQIYSLAQQAKVTDRCAVFRSHIDGSLVEISPERAIEIQEALAGDVAMVLDHFVGLPNSSEAIADATRRTILWAQRCRDAATRDEQALFGIVQGGLEPKLRIGCAERLVELGFAGYAVGGLSVGEDAEDMYRVLDITVPVLPEDRPRYVMGVGSPENLLEAIRRGIDLFDCVMPTRNGRNALAFTDHGRVRLRNQRFATDPRPLEEDCPCLACRHSRAYLRHLFMAREMLGPILLTSHNLTYYQRLLSAARQAIFEGRYLAFCAQKRKQWEASSEKHHPRSSTESD